MGIIDGNTRFVNVRLDDPEARAAKEKEKKKNENKNEKKNQKKKGNRPERTPENCKWCDLGECWDHQGVERPEKKEAPKKPKVAPKVANAGKVIKGAKLKTANVPTSGKAAGKGNMMAMMMNMMKMMGGKGM